jgi:hypothetical protein
MRKPSDGADKATASNAVLDFEANVYPTICR